MDPPCDPPQVLSELLRKMPGIAWATDPDLRCTFASGLELAAAGLTADEIVGKTLYEVLQTEDRTVAIVAAHLAALAGDVADFEQAWNGRTFQGTVQPLRDEAGRVTGCLGFAQDITGRKQVEEALRENEELFRNIFEEGPLGMVLLNVETLQAVKVNRAFCQIVGYGPEELLGKNPAFLTHPEDRGTIPAARQTILSGAVPSYRWEKRYVIRDGRVIWVRVTGTNQLDRYGKPYGLAMVEDITEQKEAEKQVRKEQENLRKLLSLYDRDRQLVAYEIHDGLAQYLAGALMQLESYGRHRAILSETAEKPYRVAQELISKGLREVRSLISGLRPPILDELGVIAAIEHLVCDQRQQSKMQIVFKHRAEFHRLALPLENALFRIVQESLTNAVRYSKSDKCLIRLSEDDRYVRVEIRDWGIGFNPKRIREDAFGISGIRERARLLGGKAVFKTALGAGTRVLVRLPIVLAEADHLLAQTSAR